MTPRCCCCCRRHGGGGGGARQQKHSIRLGSMSAVPSLVSLRMDGCATLMQRATSAALACLMVVSGGGDSSSALAYQPPPDGMDTPYTRGMNLEYGPVKGSNGMYTIRKCNGAVQPNCVSTSSTTRLYAPPFTATDTDTVEHAIEEFDTAIRSIDPGVSLVESVDTLPLGGMYRRYSVPSPLSDVDFVEVLITMSESEPTVFYKSQASKTRYIWPIQQPIGDFDAQKKRMARLRQSLGWKLLVGDCDLIECYDY